MKCWICGSEATTGEHKIKKSLLKEVFIDNFKNQEMLHFKNNKFTKIQGIDSSKIKYKESLCAYCNNQYTQTFDRAYDTFIDFIMNNFSSINQKRIINFYDIYKESFPKEQTNLFKYFVKIFGCDLNDNGFSVPKDIIELLNKEHFETKLRISFSINEDYLNINYQKKGKYGIGYLVTSQTNLKTKNELNTWYNFEIINSYLSIHFFYNCPFDLGLGSDWIANKQFLYLGSSSYNKYKN